MSEFMVLDAESPATLGSVVEAVSRLSTLSETRILELVSAGRIQDLFPFRPAALQSVPADTVAEEELVEASAFPLSEAERSSLIGSSLPMSPANSARRR